MFSIHMHTHKKRDTCNILCEPCMERKQSQLFLLFLYIARLIEVPGKLHLVMGIVFIVVLRFMKIEDACPNVLRSDVRTPSTCNLMTEVETGRIEYICALFRLMIGSRLNYNRYCFR